jgi:glycosyltransferase involved in cell wall biosynthesis
MTAGLSVLEPPPCLRPQTPPDVSIVVPIYNEVDNLPDLVARIAQAMAGSRSSFELLAVDDGSTDGSRARLRELAAGRPGCARCSWRATTASRARCRPASTACAAATW